MNTKIKGNWGENEACSYLKKLGYRIIKRNFSTRHGEIDIIAVDRSCLVFIEVKTRKNSYYGNASEYVNWKKQQKIIFSAKVFLGENNDTEMRFDIIEVYYDENGEELSLKSINHIKSAFISH